MSPASRKRGTTARTRATRPEGATAADAEREVDGFIAKFASENQRLIRRVRAALRKRLPGAFELVYDNYNFFVIGFGPTDRPSDGVLSLAADANGVTVFFLRGVGLPDPERLLRGSGTQVRSIRVPNVRVLAEPAVDALIEAALEQSGKPLPGGRARVIVRSVSQKQRSRRRA